jgi:hypothetical protein
MMFSFCQAVIPNFTKKKNKIVKRFLYLFIYLVQQIFWLQNIFLEL